MVVLGEALVDVVQTADGTRTSHPGGSPANVAVGLARLGADVTLLTETGDDDGGELVRRHLLANGVRLPDPPQPGCRTSVAVASIAPGGAASYDFDIHWGGAAAGRPLPPGAVCAHTGSIAAVMPPGGLLAPDWLAAARGTATVSYDPNVRPALMGDHDAATAHVTKLVGFSDVVKTSDEDLDWLYPGEPIEQVAERLLALGPALVVVTRGGEGAYAVTAHGTAPVDAVQVDVVDTVGAGDAFMAGLLDGLRLAGLLGADRRDALHSASPQDLAASLQRAARVAAYTVGRAGADPPRADQL